MTKNCPYQYPQVGGGAPRTRRVRDCLAGLLVFAALQTCDAAVSEQVTIPADKLTPDFHVTSPQARLPLLTLSLPPNYEAVELPQTRTFPLRDFRPRGRSVLDKDPPDSATEAAPLIHGTTVWQRMSDYRVHDRVRVLTLWEAGGSSVSLLAGKKGEPSLQWTSRSLNHGRASRGLLDKFFSTSIAGAARSLHLPSHTSGSEAAAEPARVLPSAAGTGK